MHALNALNAVIATSATGASSWLFSTLLAGTAVFAVGCGCAFALRKNPAWENAIWRATLLLALLAPLAPAVASRLPAHGREGRLLWADWTNWAQWIEERWDTERLTPAPRGLVLPTTAADAETSADAPAVYRADAAVSPAKRRIRAWFIPGLLCAWGVGAAASLAVLGVGAARVRGLIRASRRLESEASHELLEDCARMAGVRRVPALRAAGDDLLASPLLAGWRRPCILVPAHGDAPRRAMLLHELAHLRRADLWWMTLGRAVGALWWFHPLAWRMGRRLERSAESVCDDLVLLWTQDAPGYAEQLMRFARAAQTGRRVALAGVAVTGFRSEVGQRIERMLAPGWKPRASIGRSGAALLTGGAALGLALLTAASPGRGQAGPTTPPASGENAPKPKAAEAAGTPPPAPSDKAAVEDIRAATEKARAAEEKRNIAIIERKLNIIIPHAEFSQIPLRDAVEFLRQEARRLDTEENPDYRGVNIFLKLTRSSVAAQPGNPSAAGPSTPSGSSANAPADPASALVNLSFNNRSCLDALSDIASQAGLKLKVEQYAVSLVPMSEMTERLVTAEFVLTPEAFADLSASAAKEKDKSNAAVPTRLNGVTWLKGKGIEFPPGASATYVAKTQKFIVRNTQPNVDKIKALLSAPKTEK